MHFCSTHRLKGVILTPNPDQLPEPFHLAQVHDKPTLGSRDIVRATEQDRPSLPQGPSSGHAQGDTWRSVTKRDLPSPERMTPEQAAKQDPRGAFLAAAMYHKNSPRYLMMDGPNPSVSRARPATEYELPAEVAKLGPISDSTRYQRAKELQASVEPIVRRSEGWPAKEHLVAIPRSPASTPLPTTRRIDGWPLRAAIVVTPRSPASTPLPSRRLRRSSYGSANHVGAESPSIDTDDLVPLENPYPTNDDRVLLWPGPIVKDLNTTAHNTTSSHHFTATASPFPHNTTSSHNSTFNTTASPFPHNTTSSFLHNTTATTPHNTTSSFLHNTTATTPQNTTASPFPHNTTSSFLHNTTATTPHNTPASPFPHNTTSTPTPTPTPLSKRQAKFRPNDLPPMWEAVMHGPFDVQDVVFGDGKMIPKRALTLSSPPTLSSPSTTTTTNTTNPPTTTTTTTTPPTLLPRDEPDDESLTQREYEELKKGRGGKKGKGKKGKGKREVEGDGHKEGGI